MGPTDVKIGPHAGKNYMVNVRGKNFKGYDSRLSARLIGGLMEGALLERL